MHYSGSCDAGMASCAYSDSGYVSRPAGSCCPGLEVSIKIVSSPFTSFIPNPTALVAMALFLLVHTRTAQVPHPSPRHIASTDKAIPYRHPQLHPLPRSISHCELARHDRERGYPRYTTTRSSFFSTAPRGLADIMYVLLSISRPPAIPLPAPAPHLFVRAPPPSSPPHSEPALTALSFFVQLSFIPLCLRARAHAHICGHYGFAANATRAGGDAHSYTLARGGGVIPHRHALLRAHSPPRIFIPVALTMVSSSRMARAFNHRRALDLRARGLVDARAWGPALTHARVFLLLAWDGGIRCAFSVHRNAYLCPTPVLSLLRACKRADFASRALAGLRLPMHAPSHGTAGSAAPFFAHQHASMPIFRAARLCFTARFLFSCAPFFFASSCGFDDVRRRRRELQIRPSGGVRLEKRRGLGNPYGLAPAGFADADWSPTRLLLLAIALPVPGTPCRRAAVRGPHTPERVLLLLCAGIATAGRGMTSQALAYIAAAR
ncbi:hypothetical protein C8J57DRAFT_1718531 [Mycena rebaudengoi]|nr:hypothetical protein C8J57DRAFT_1718531 [Mycena rebaudengoi]